MITIGSAAGSALKVVTPSAGDVDLHAEYVEHTLSSDDFESFPANAAVTTATTTTIVGAAGAGVKRNVTGLVVRNVHASTAQNPITVLHHDGTTEIELFECNLAAGEALVMNEQGTFFVFDSSGGVKMGATAATETAPGLIEIASAAEMEAGTDTTRAVAPGYLHRHPSSVKCWLSCGVAADIQQSYNITSLTDTGTGVVTVTIATDFAGTNWCCVPGVEATATTWAVANARECHVRSTTRAAGSVAMDCIDNTATTNLVKDPSSWHMVGLGDQP